LVKEGEAVKNKKKSSIGRAGESKGMTRRDFAKTSAIASFAILSSKSGVAETNVDTLKVGLIGCGGRGTGAAINILESDNNVKLIAMADMFQDRLDGARQRIANADNPKVKSKFAVEDELCFVGVDAYKKIVATDVDIILECTPPYSRPKHIEAAVEAKKHIFTEKPAGVDPVGIRRFMAAAKKHKEMGLSLVAGTQRRHERPYIETVKKIQDGAIGEIIALRAHWCGSLPFAHERREGMSDLEYRLRNWYNYCWACGDNIVEQHVHNLDVCNWLMGGPPRNVLASGGRAWKPNLEKYGDIFDHFSCEFEYPNGVRMWSFSRHWYGSTNSVLETVYGTKGKSNCVDMGEGGINPYVQEHIDLVNSITGSGPYCHEGQRVAESTMTAIMARMSAYTGQRLSFSGALETDLSIGPDVLDFSLEYPVGPVPKPGGPRD